VGRWLRRFVWLIVLGGAVRALSGTVVRLVGERAAPEADDFDLLAVMGGRVFTSRAVGLRGGRVRVVAGGADVDLRSATLSPEGATVELTVVAGGIRLVVDPAWKVETDVDLRWGQAQIDVADPEGLPEDAPTLRVHGAVCGGGVVVAAVPVAQGG